MADLRKLRINRGSEEQPQSKTWKALLTVMFVVALAGTGFYLYSGPLKPATVVETTVVTTIYPSQASSVLNASGYVVAQRQADVASKATGRLERIFVEEGSIVRKGQVIARLENSDVEAVRRQTEAEVQVAKAQLVEAKAHYERMKLLWEQKLVSQSEYDLAEAKYRSAGAGVEAVVARLRSAEVNVENTFIRAPFDGTVLRKYADVGEMVAPFGSAGNSKGAVVLIADMTSLQVEADVSESNIEKIQVGQPCEIILDAFPNKRYRGEVHMIVPTADRAKATVMTKVRFLERDEKVLPEMSARVNFLSEAISEEQLKSVPKLVLDPAAVRERNGEKIVYIVDKDQVTERVITLGGRIGNLVEVVSGVSAGEELVLNPPAGLKNGMRIKQAESKKG